MSLRSHALRTGVRAASGALAVLLAATAPAFAATPAAAAGHTAGQAAEPAPAATVLGADPAAHPPSYTGRVTARSGLILRDKPTRGSRIVRTEPYGAYVHIFCRTRGDSVAGNDVWYLLTDGTWAWGSAAYIANVGPVPRWC